MEAETSSLVKIRELEEQLKAEQIRTAQLEKELAERKEATRFWESHETHVQYQKDLQKFITPGEVDLDDLKKLAEKLLNEQIWMTQSYYEIYNKWEKEQKVHKECRRKVSQLQEEYGQLSEEFERWKVSHHLTQDELEEVREYGMWFEKENKKLESCQAELAQLPVEVTKIPELESLVAHLNKPLYVIQGNRSPSPGPDDSWKAGTST